MGQQQLLLVILVTIIVGIATVVAINTFGSAADSANVDAVRQDLTSMAAAAQGYYMKPEALGGGGQDFGGITYNNMGSVACETISSDGLTCTNSNGEYTFSTVAEDAQTFDITGTPATAEGTVTITINPDGADMQDYVSSGGA